MHTLYLCYFGLREPLVQTQVLPYLRELRRDEIEVSLLTFEPDHARSWSATEEREWKERLRAEGIEWYSLPYHKRPSALVTPYDIMRGAWFAAGLARRHNIRSEEHTSELQSRADISYAVFCLKNKRTPARSVAARSDSGHQHVRPGRWRT